MKKYLKYIIIGVVIVGLIGGYYFYISNRSTVVDVEETTTEISAAKKLLLRSMSIDYPPSPKEVVKYYADITVALYTSEYSEDEFKLLALRLRDLYDEDLLAANEEQAYLSALKNEVQGYKDQGIAISSYATSSSTDVFYFNEGGYNCSRLYATFTMKQGTSVELVREIFVLRKDTEGHWKIMGWALAKDEE